MVSIGTLGAAISVPCEKVDECRSLVGNLYTRNRAGLVILRR